MHYDILTKRTIKFPKDKGVLLMRGGIVSRDQLLNANGDNIIINNLTFGIARRILQFTDIYVGLEEHYDFIFVKNNDEDALEFAYTADAFTTPESEEDHDEIINHDEDNTSPNEEVEEFDDGEFDNYNSEEDVIKEDNIDDESLDSNDNIFEDEETTDDTTDEVDDTVEEEVETTEKVVITRAPHPNNNHKNKKHHK